MKKQLGLVFGALLLMALYQGCSGSFESGSRQSADGSSSIDLTDITLGSKATCKASEFGLDKAGIRRLSMNEVLLATRSFLGFDENYRDVLQEIYQISETTNLEKVSDYDPYFNGEQVTAWMQLASKLSGVIVAGNVQAKVAGIIGNTGSACIANTRLAGDQRKSCWQAALNTMIFKAWRVPAKQEQIDYIYENIVSKQGALDAIRDVTYHLLISPYFLFHVEEGGAIENGRARLTDYEIMNRIFYATIGYLPTHSHLKPNDSVSPEIYKEMLDKAKNGELQDLATIESYVKQLLATESGKDKLEQFYSNWLEYSHVSAPLNDRDIKKIHNLEAGHLKDEITHYLNYVLWDIDGNFQDLMTLKKAFPMRTAVNGTDRDGEYDVSGLRAIYQTNGYADQSRDNLTAYDALQHPGLLFRAGLLTEGSLTTSSILRGVKLLNRFLCVNIPPPPSEVLASRDETLNIAFDPLQLAGHEIVYAMTKAPACIGCHQSINPAGFAYEQFDTFGMIRTEQLVHNFDEDNGALYEVIGQHELPTGPYSIRVSQNLTIEANGPQSIADSVATAYEAQQCMSKFFVDHLNRQVVTKTDFCEVQEMANDLYQGKSIIDSMAKSIANEGIFWRQVNQESQ